MNGVDLVIIVLIVIAATRGYRRGFLGLLFELGGGFLGLVVGLWLGPQAGDLVTDQADLTGALVSLLVVFVCLSLGQTGGFLLGHRFGSKVTEGGYGSLNSGAGVAFGIVTTLLATWLIASLLVEGPSRPLARAVRQSAIVGWTNSVLPQPPNVLAYLRQYIRNSRFPQVFAGLPRETAPPVRLPSSAEARRAVQAAQESTVRIVVPACGGTQLGSGWIAAEGTVVTNAHVVAGGDSFTIEDSAGEHSATVVLYDPRTDLAILRAEGLAGDPLPLEQDVVDRGSAGATLGFPGSAGGRLVWHRAAVQAEFPAVGRDIYGRSTVRRDVYEVRSRVREGDSGGPFVLADGTVAGVVFAASTTDSEVGYALTGPEVVDEIEDGSQSTEPVSTQGCTR